MFFVGSGLSFLITLTFASTGLAKIRFRSYGIISPIYIGTAIIEVGLAVALCVPVHVLAALSPRLSLTVPASAALILLVFTCYRCYLAATAGTCSCNGRPVVVSAAEAAGCFILFMAATLLTVLTILGVEASKTFTTVGLLVPLVAWQIGVKRGALLPRAGVFADAPDI